MLSNNRIYVILCSALMGLGFAVLLLSLTIANFEYSYDDFNVNRDRIFRVVKNATSDNGLDHSTSVPFQFSSQIKNLYPLEATTNIYHPKFDEQFDIRNKEGVIVKQILQEGVFFAEPDLLKMFPLEGLAGNIGDALAIKHSCIISRSVAYKMFGPQQESIQNAIGTTVNLGAIQLIIQGVFEDQPKNTNYQFKFIISYQTLKDYAPSIDNWTTIDAANKCVLMINPERQHMLEEMITKHFNVLDRVENDKQAYKLQPLSDIHLSTTYDNFDKNVISADRVQIVLTVGVAIFLVTIFNFLSYSFLRNVEKTKAYVTRTILGAGKWDVIWTAIKPSLAVVASSFVFGLLLSEFLLDQLADTLGTLSNRADIFSKENATYLSITVVATILVIFIPTATFISKLKPYVVLKGSIEVKFSKGILYRKLFVTLIQLVLFQALMLGLYVVSDQVKLLLNKDLGFEKRDIILLSIPRQDQRLLEELKSQLLSHSAIQNVSFSLSSPTGVSNYYWDFGNSLLSGKKGLIGNFKPVDANYIDLFKIKLIAGRNFFKNDKNGVIVTRRLTKLLQLKQPEEALGLQITSGSDKFVIIGVVEDFHTSPLTKRLEYPFLIYDPSSYYEMAICIQPTANLGETIPYIQDQWKKAFPDGLFGYRHYGDQIESYYKFEKDILKFLAIFSVIGLIINSFALYAIIKIYIRSKLKELVIRRIHGANFNELSYTLLRTAALLFAASTIISLAGGYMALNSWLSQFAFRIELSSTYFITVCLGSVLISIPFIFFPVIKTYRQPLSSLIKYE